MRISDWSSDVCSSDLRFSGSVLDEDEACERHHGDGNHSKNDRRIPGEAVSAQTSEKDQRSEEHTSTPVTNAHLVCRLLLEKKNTHLNKTPYYTYELLQ